MEWERGDLPPGRVMATFKTGGLRLLLEALAAQATAAAPGGDVAGTEGEGAPASGTWTPVV
jgi:hypothetical protein